MERVVSHSVKLPSMGGIQFQEVAYQGSKKHDTRGV